VVLKLASSQVRVKGEPFVSSLSRFRWEAAGGLVLLVLLSALVYVRYAHGPVEEMGERAKRQQVAAQLRFALSAAVEAEKSAVLANTDRASQEFADEARAATAEAEKKRAELADLLRRSGSDGERELLARFSESFVAFQEIDKQLLDLAVRNTNLKASALLFGPLADASHEIDAALSRIIEGSTMPSELRLAAGARAAAFRIQVLLPPHIAEEADPRMDELEARMRREDQAVREDLKKLGTLGSGRERADVRSAAAAYDRFSDLVAQILKLSRENTNVRSLAISLNEKRSVTVACQSTLASLERAISEEPITGISARPFKPR
jgi:hypothetical protein